MQKRKKVRGFKRRKTLNRKRKPKKKGKQPKKQRGSNVGQRKMKRNQKRTQKWIYDPKKQKINTKTKIKHKTHKIMKYLVERKKNKNQESYKSRKLSRSVLTGDNCNWLDFDTARSRGAGCADGTKMVIKNKYIKLQGVIEYDVTVIIQEGCEETVLVDQWEDYLWFCNKRRKVCKLCKSC